jgi:hypothetical protein
MAISASVLPEFEHEMANTRKILAIVPEADVAWKPHPKSTSLGALTLHLSNIPHWASAVRRTTRRSFNRWPRHSPSSTPT